MIFRQQSLNVQQVLDMAIEEILQLIMEFHPQTLTSFHQILLKTLDQKPLVLVSREKHIQRSIWKNTHQMLLRKLSLDLDLIRFLMSLGQKEESFQWDPKPKILN